MPTETKPIELNTKCPDFDLPGVDGKNHSLKSYADNKILVVGFTCNHCPYVKAYESRLNELAKEFQSKGVAFVCINSNDSATYPDDSFDNMKKRAEDLGFVFDYLRDESQEVARAFNAACTPEFYVYGEDRKLKYHGRIDDNYQDEAAVKEHYMRDALNDLLSGSEPANPQTSAIGCSIKWKAA